MVLSNRLKIYYSMYVLIINPYVITTMSLQLGSQGFGCMGLTAFYGAAVQNEHGIKVMKSAYDSGCRMFDTAQICK